MRAKLTGMLVATVMAVALMPGVASANKPLDVDCDIYAAAIVLTDAIIDSVPGGPQFDSLGDLNSAVKKDPALFALLAGLVSATSGGEVNFTDPEQVVPTTAKCGLIGLLQAEIAD